MTRNADLFTRASRSIPGGVNSPVRAFRSVGGTPRFITRAQGPYLWDADGTRYIDYIGSWGPAILGHAHPEVVRAVQDAAAQGLSFGAPSEAEIEIAEALIATAIGLFAAIPAVVAYNRFSARSEHLIARYYTFADEFQAILHRKVHTQAG